jgi:uncharacterized OB-fold protein
VSQASDTYLGEAMPVPAADADGLQTPFWSGLAREELMIQRCRNCRTWIFAPEWICHHCHSFDLGWEAVEPVGRLYSWTRVWRPSLPTQTSPYLTVVVELPQAGGVRLIGNLLGDARQEVAIGAPATGVFEHHPPVEGSAPRPGFSLLQWKLANA